MMKTGKKRWMAFLFALSLMFMPLQQGEALAAVYTVKKGSIRADFKKAKIRQVDLFLYGGGRLTRQKGRISGVCFDNLIKNQVYTLKIRSKTEGEGYGPWTVKYFVPTSFTVKRQKKQLRVTTRKVENVSAYRLYVSKEGGQAFKKAAKILPGQSVLLTKEDWGPFYEGLKLDLKLVPVLENGKKAAALTRTFRWKG